MPIKVAVLAFDLCVSVSSQPMYTYSSLSGKKQEKRVITSLIIYVTIVSDSVTHPRTRIVTDTLRNASVLNLCLDNCHNKN
jgi:hypothetical protein